MFSSRHTFYGRRARTDYGRSAGLPSVEIADGLWDPSGRRLTLFLHPGLAGNTLVRLFDEATGPRGAPQPSATGWLGLGFAVAPGVAD